MIPSHAVIIPHFNDTARLRRCLGALFAPGIGTAEVVVVDNGSTEPTGWVSADFPAVRLLHEPMKGAANARNRGVAETTAPWVFFLDADCVPAPDWLSAAQAGCGAADIVGGAIDVFDETPPPRSGAQAFETVFAFNYRDYIEKKHFSVTANLLTSRTVFDAVGPFIDGLSEDAEWCLRARAKGFRIALDENLRVSHPTRSDMPALDRKWRRITREMFALHQTRHPGLTGRVLWAARAPVVALSALAHLPKLVASPRLSGGAERASGAAALISMRCRRAWWMLRQAFGGQI
ncbi:MAG: glycosyltransferase [Rhodobacteraceae bacterium]|nr:glycosyltransferase [Paracoccaceae bacterium]